MANEANIADQMRTKLDPNIAPDVGGGKGETSLPEGFIAHSGGRLPVALDSKPGVLFGDGLLVQPGEILASEWIYPKHGHDLWRWERAPGPADIIAYKVENPS